MFIFSTIPNDTLQYLQCINDNVNSVKRIVDVSNSTIANEISAVNTMLVAFTIGLSVIGILLGIYISWLKSRVSKMSDNISEKEQTIIKLAKTVEETEKKIQSDISGLYAKLREEETITLLHRLKEEPEDIINLGKLLFARSLDDTGFPIMKQAFMKLMTMGPEINEGDLFNLSYREQYTIQFFQHYLMQSMLDNDLRPIIIEDFKISMNCAFKNDIIKSTEDICQALSVSNAPFDKVGLLANYLEALNQSKYSNLAELKIIFQEKVNNNILVDAIDKCTTDKVYLELFGVEAPNKSAKTSESEITKMT